MQPQNQKQKVTARERKEWRQSKRKTEKRWEIKKKSCGCVAAGGEKKET